MAAFLFAFNPSLPTIFMKRGATSSQKPVGPNEYIYLYLNK